MIKKINLSSRSLVSFIVSSLLAHQRFVQQHEIGKNFFPASEALPGFTGSNCFCRPLSSFPSVKSFKCGGGLEESFYFLVVTLTAAIKLERQALGFFLTKTHRLCEQSWIQGDYFQFKCTIPAKKKNFFQVTPQPPG